MIVIINNPNNTNMINDSISIRDEDSISNNDNNLLKCKKKIKNKNGCFRKCINTKTAISTITMTLLPPTTTTTTTTTHNKNERIKLNSSCCVVQIGNMS